jgi:hypothetical protein
MHEINRNGMWAHRFNIRNLITTITAKRKKTFALVVSGVLSGALALGWMLGCTVPADQDTGEGADGAAAVVEENPKTEWVTYYDGPDHDDDRMFGAVELAEGGYVAVVNSENKQESGDEQKSETATLLRYSATGAEEWATLIPDTHLMAVVETEAGLLAIGSTTSKDAPFFKEGEAPEEPVATEGDEAAQPDSNAAVLLLDGKGEIIWARSLGGSDYDCFGGSYWQVAGYPVELPNGNFLIPGNTYSEDGDFAQTHLGVSDGILAEIDPTGSLVATDVFGGSGYDVLHGLRITETGEFFIAGTTHVPEIEETEELLPADGMFAGLVEDGGESNVFVSKLDAQRKVVWTTLIPSPGSWVVGIALADDGGVTVAADLDEYVEDTATKLYVKGLDAEGEIIWENEYSNNKDDAATIYVASFEATADGNYLLGGEVHYDSIIDEGSEGLRGWLGCIGPKGELLWERSFEGTDYEMHIHVSPTADGGSILAAQQAREKGDWDAALIKYAPHAE